MFRLMVLSALAVASAASDRVDVPVDYNEVVQRVAEMTWDYKVCEYASQYGLDVVNVTWEDTGRYYGSCWGPNISDMTIQVHHEDPWNPGQTALTCMPVIRHPNFHDLSADLDPDHFFLLVGNERGEDLHPVTLRDFVADLRYYLHDPGSWRGDEEGLLADRDSLVLVSAQAVFLPIPDNGDATFNPVLFNYQSYEKNPAVLTILATREGTSVTVIDNVRDPVPGAWSWGQRLFFNEDGMRASLTGERLSDFHDNGGDQTGPMIHAASEEGLNMVLLIQIPLRQKQPRNTWFDDVSLCCCECAAGEGGVGGGASDVEAAVVGHGDLEGPFTEIDGLRVERDPEFPIRVTVQFYKATSNGVVTEDDMQEIYEQIQRVYDDGEYVGSLVVPDPGQYRPTDWDRDAVPRSLNDYWRMVQYNFLEKIGRLDLLEGYDGTKDKPSRSLEKK
ncbi:hypothetical protein JW921_09610 [Candidatus Fermentibacterales bacterium]|nr:hypothetical protein [Candidatus Fermentibacterales bacterium]